MIEPEAVIDPEAAPPAPRSRRHRRAVVAGVTLLALVAGAIAVAGDGRPEAKPLALMAGNGAGGRAETMAAGTPAPATPAIGTAADARSALHPYGGWGLKFEVDGQLPELPDRANAWWVTGPDLDRAAVIRIAEALGVSGTPVQRDGGWFVDSGDWTLSAYGGDAMGTGGVWYLNLYRSRYDGRDADGAETPTGPAISRADAERRVRELLDRMGAPRASWKVETTDTDIATGWACTAPAPELTAEEARKLEADKLSQLERENLANAGSPADAEAPARAASDAATSSGATSSGTNVSSGGATPTVAPSSDGPTTVDPAPPAAWGSGWASGFGASGNAAGSAGTAPAGKPAATGVASCPPPPAPVKGLNVALYPVLDGHRADWPVWNVTMRSDGRIENLNGSWVRFEKGGDYKLRGVDAALKELQSPAVAYATDIPATAIEPATDLPAEGTVDSVGSATPAAPAEESGSPAADEGSGSAPAKSTGSAGSANTATAPSSSAGSANTATAPSSSAGSANTATAPSSSAGLAPSREPLRDDAASAPTVDLPADAPVCPPVPMPLPAQDAHATTAIAATCAPPAPQVVKITGVELGLLQTSVFENGEVRMAMVPSYRFVGHFDNGTPWETSVIALHPDAIAPPPDHPATDDVRSGGGTTGVGAASTGVGVGKAVPPTPTPEPEPAIVRDSSR